MTVHDRAVVTANDHADHAGGAGGAGGRTAPLRLEAEDVSKAFGGQLALERIYLRVRPGEVHGLVGQNGSGKSTFAKILSGYHVPDRGARIQVDGRPLAPPIRPRELRRSGIAIVHQTLGLLDAFTVAENMRIGSFKARGWSRRIDWAAEWDRTARVLASLGSTVSPRVRVGDLSAEDRATVAIAKALQDHSPGRGLIVFDESTRALTKESLAHFYQLVRGVVRSGASVLLISHRLDEVLDVAHRVTVLRDGRVVQGDVPTARLTHAQLGRLILGRDLLPQARPRQPGNHTTSRRPSAPAHRAPDPATSRRSAGPVRVHGVAGRLVHDVDLVVRPGEIVGLTGVVGSGYEELPYLLSGAQVARAGALSVGDASIDLTGPSLRRLLGAGVVLVPERRDVAGLALSLSVRDNITLPRVRQRGSSAWTGRRWQDEEAGTLMDRLGVVPRDPGLPAAALSGGNQQKVLLAKWLAERPALLVLHEPTQGVDIGARLDLIAAVRAVADEHACPVLVASIEATDLAAMCDRVLVVGDGRVVAELAGELTEERIVEAVYPAMPDLEARS